MDNSSRHGKTVGVLGGMGPAATVDFYRRIVDSTAARHDQEHIHVLIDSLPQVPDRTRFLLHGGEDPEPTLIQMARRLQSAGASFLVMPCNTASAFTDRIQGAVTIPVIDWAATTAQGVVNRTDPITRVGLLATDGTIETALYHDAFERLGVHVLVPEAPHQALVMDAIYGPEGVKAGYGDLGTAQRAVADAARALVVAGADAILLACTELSVLFAVHGLSVSVSTFDASQIVAEHAISLAGGTIKEPSAREGVRGSGGVMT